MIPITDKQAENTRMAYAIMAGIPGELIDLDVVRENPVSNEEMFDCGSCGCIAGWLSAHPYFIKQGLKATVIDSGYEVYASVDLTMDGRLFGSQFIFSGNIRCVDSQKQEALERLRFHLLDAGRITQERSLELAKQEANL